MKTPYKTYLTQARQFYKASGRTNRKHFTWDNKWPGVRILLARLGEDDLGMVSESQHYVRNLMKFSKFTKKGLVFLDEWGVLRHAANNAFLALVTAKLDHENSDDMLKFAKEQMFYIYGSTGRSYIVGFGKNPPKVKLFGVFTAKLEVLNCKVDSYGFIGIQLL